MCVLSSWLLYDMHSNSVPNSTAVKTNLTASGEKTLKVNRIGSQECFLLPGCVPRGCPGCSIKNWRLTVTLWEQPSVPGSAAAQAAPSTRKSFPSPQLITPNRPSGLRWCVTFLGNLSWLPVSSSLLFVYVSYIGVATAAVLYYYICVISWSVLSH